MTLSEVADWLARRMNCTVEAGENPYEMTLVGQGYRVLLSSFFGGWQATLRMGDRQPIAFYGESAEMLETRLKAKLSGLPADF